jgi:hypothetical protein
LPGAGEARTLVPARAQAPNRIELPRWVSEFHATHVEGPAWGVSLARVNPLLSQSYPLIRPPLHF